MQHFPSTLRSLRERKGLTQQELAERIGLSASAVSMYENGRREPTFEILQSLAEVFSLRPEELLSDCINADDDIWLLREEMRANPELRLLVDIARKSTPADIMRTIRILTVLSDVED